MRSSMRSSMRSWMGLALAALVFLLPGSAAAQFGTLFGSDQLGNLFTVNLGTGVATPVGPLGTFGVTCCTEIEYDPSTGRAFAQERDGLFLISEFSTQTGALIAPPVPDGGSFTALEYVGPTLYGAFMTSTGGPSTFARLDPTTGAVITVGLTGVGPLAGLAMDVPNLTLYAVDGGPGPANLYTVSFLTGAVTVVGNTGLQLGSLEFGPNGLLYAGGTGVNAGNIYTIATATAVPALVGNYGLGGGVTGLTLVGGGDPLAPTELTFSFDGQGPSLFALDGFGIGPMTNGDVLTPTLPGPPGPNPPSLGPLPPPGIEIGGPPGAPGVVPGGLGILPGFAAFELDALSYGRDVGDTLYFSVDEFASGTAPTLPPDVFTEGIFGATEASADVYAYLGPVAPALPGPVVGNTLAVDGDGVLPGLPGTGLVEPNPPSPLLLPDAGDNLDAVDLDTTFADLLGPVFFSLDTTFGDPLEVAPINSGTALFNGFSGADVVVSVAGGAPALAIPAAALGLDLAGFDTDDLDALAFVDADGTMTLTPPDTIYFSVRRGSAVLGVLDSAFGVPIEPGDVLTVPTVAGAPPAIVVGAEALGLGTLRSGTFGPFGPDDVDALDLRFVPEPGWGAQLGAGLLLVAWLGRRRRRVEPTR